MSGVLRQPAHDAFGNIRVRRPVRTQPCQVEPQIARPYDVRVRNQLIDGLVHQPFVVAEAHAAGVELVGVLGVH